MMISMRNDCDEEYCCQENAGRSSYCTEYTSGQMTSTDSYGYGSFYFMAKIGTQVSEGNVLIVETCCISKVHELLPAKEVYDENFSKTSQKIVKFFPNVILEIQKKMSAIN